MPPITCAGRQLELSLIAEASVPRHVTPCGSGGVSKHQSCYQGLSLRGQGQSQDFFLKAKSKDMKIFQGQGQGQDFFLKAKATDINFLQDQVRVCVLCPRIDPLRFLAACRRRRLNRA